MKLKNNLLKRSIATILAITVMVVTLPVGNVFAAAETNYYDRVTDASSIDGWKEFFPVTNTANAPLSTENAGGVWTDKSVFTDSDAFGELIDRDGDDAAINMLNGSKNFLTALSAIAANKEIVGYSTVPTDTVFILDLSNSMSTTSVTELVRATNRAINDLQSMNKNNRVGVVLYSGASANRTYDDAVARLMPIDHYTTTNQNGNFIEYTGGTVRLVRGGSGVQVSGSNGTVVSESKTHSGATYIQAGLWEAWQMFDEIPDSDIVIGENNWQSGEARMPIVVLMSDGAPTLGTSFYDDVENSTYGSGNQNRTKANVGNGNDSNITIGQGFLVQLTASYVKNQIENKYKVNEEGYAGRSLFYTLGFNINSLSNTPRTIATSVLNPDSSTATDSFWDTYNKLTNDTMQVGVCGRASEDATVSIGKNSYATSKSYVDEYFSASGNGLTNAFNDIVEEIILQSRYYPTHLEGGSPDFSGYVEFTDTLGEYMEVKQINGILLGNILFDGHMMASKINARDEDGLGSVENPTVLGDEFIRAVKTRLGISDTAEAQALVAEAYKAEQLCYVTDGRGNVTKWSNYIGWFADAEGRYVGHWNENPTQTVPSNAVYKIRSYGFLGETVGSIKNSDMMYMSVQVKTNIATGIETVSWKIPAALVPMITYLIKVDGTNVENARNVRINVEDENVAPIRLIYETGLRSDLNEFNITSITDEDHLASDGYTRLFWNNYFDISSASHDQHITAKSEFTPNKENERFYYTFDSAVHKKVGSEYEIVSEREGLDPVNGTYYHRRYIFTDDSNVPVFFYEQMSAASVRAAIENGFNDEFESLEHNTVGAWVVPAGTPARELQMYQREKTLNATNSAEMIFHPYLTEYNELFYVDMNLGNNGLLSVIPATGIKITKTVDVFEPGTSDTFKFRITASESGIFDSWITALDATPSGEATAVTLRNGVYEFEMKKDQTFWLSGLSANTTYTVEEISDNSDYKIKSVKVNNESTGTTAVGTVAQYMIDDIQFVNTAVGEGDLVITKQVVDQNGNTVDISDSVTFTAEVALTAADGSPVSGTFAASNAAGRITVPASGKFTVTLKEGESFILRNVPEETRYTVTETNIPNGFALNSEESELSGIVDATSTDRALIVNTYSPVSTNGREVNVVVTKQISGNRTNWLSGESYEFIVERSNGDDVFTSVITADSDPKTASGTLSGETFAAAGTYRYRITEKVGTQGGITYDTVVRRFAVEVADSDMDGDLEIVGVTNEASTVVTKSGNTYTVSANFNNEYAPTGSASVTIDVVKKMEGDYRLNGFQFALYNSENVEEADELLRSTVTDALGGATISLTYPAEVATIEGATFTYWLAEINTGNPNITYDDTVYKVEITVRDNGDGTVSATSLISGLPQGETAPSFTNVFTPSASAFVTLTANKTIEGDRVLNQGEFSFVIEALTNGAPMPAASTVRNAANGAVVFDVIEFTEVGTYKYRIYESDENKIGGFDYDESFYEITVVVTDNGDATLSAAVTRVVKENENDTGRELSATELMSFKNLYDATDAVVTLSGTKNLTGKEMQDDEFTFKLEAVTDEAPMPAAAAVTNTARGVFTFGEITFDKAGTYVYRLYEQANGDTRYDFDESIYTVTITVTDNSRGLLTARVVLQKDNMPSTEIVFSNGFVPTSINYDIYADFGGTKILDGRELAEGEFSFVLINAINGSQIGRAVTNDADGEFKFPAVILPEAGIYHFKITEVLGEEAGVSYDTAAYHIRLEVVQHEDGTLSIANKRLVKATVVKEDVGGVLTEVTHYENITENGEIVFNNIYEASPSYVTFTATKTLTGRDLVDGEFKFDLHKTDDTFAYSDNTLLQNDVVLVLEADGSGKITFRPVSFDEVGTYYFVIREDEADEKGITADKTAYEIEVTVTDPGKGRLEASVKVGGDDITATTSEKVTFNNLYEVEAAEIVVQGTKTLNGRKIKGGEFSFTLYDEDGAEIETVTNDENGNFGFTAIPVTEAGIYVYTVREVKGDEEGMTYDSTVYTVTVTVTDNLDGTFKVEYTYAADRIGAEAVNFVNNYTDPTPPPQIPQTGDYNNGIILWMAAFFVSGGLLAAVAVSKAVKRKTEE